MSDDSTRMMPTGVGGGSATLMGGATQQMPAAGIGDAFRTQMGGTAVCPVCSSTTPLMETYCGECGFLMSSTPAESLEIPTEEAPVGELIALDDGRKYRLRAGVNTVGRQGTDVLLNEGTISRVHAKITIENGSVTVEDMGSSNGTKVGDLRIGANQPTNAAPGTVLKFGSWQARLEVGAGGSAERTVMVANGEQTQMPSTIGSSIDDRTLVGLPAEAVGAEAAFSSGVAPGSAAAVTDSEEVSQGTDVEEAAALLVPSEGPSPQITIPQGTITIGRKPGNTIILPDAYISGRHADIITDANGTYLIDVGSSNGTFVNGQKLAPQERQLLLEGDSVKLGQTEYTFRFVETDETSNTGIASEGRSAERQSDPGFNQGSTEHQSELGSGLGNVQPQIDLGNGPPHDNHNPAGAENV